MLPPAQPSDADATCAAPPAAPPVARVLPRPLLPAVLLAVFALDLATQQGFAAGSLYLLVLILAALERRPRTLFLTALAAAVLTVLGLALSPAAAGPIPPSYVIANRAVSLLAIAAITLVAALAQRALARAEEAGERERAARRAEQRHASLLDIASRSARLGGWSVRLDDGELRWSSRAARLNEVLPGMRIDLTQAIGFVAPEFRGRTEAALQRCIEHGIPFDEELQVLREDGQRRWVRAIGEAVRDDAGRIVELQGSYQDIDERKLIESHLSRSLRRFAELADAMPLVVWSADGNGRVDFVNAGLRSFTGLSQVPATRKAWLALVHADDRPRLERVWRDARSARQSWSGTYRGRRADGAYRWHLLRATPVKGPDGTVERWYGTATDIHDQKLLQEQASELAQRLSETLESVTDAIFLLDRDWNFRFLNPRAELLLQRRRAELLGRNLWSEFPAAVGGRFEHEYRRAMEGGEHVRFEARYEPLGRIFQVNAYPSRQGLAVYFQDLTEQRADDAMLRLLRTAVARLNDIVMILEAEPLDEPGPRIVFVNEAFERLTGYPVHEVIGRSPRFLQGPRTQVDVLERIRAAQGRWEPVHAELINYTRDGRELTLEIDMVPMADASGRYSHWVAIERDVGERRHLEEQLRQAQRMESIGQLTGGIAHDFNNLLTVIQGNAELLNEQLAAQPRLAHLASMIETASQRGAQLTHRLLAFARRQALEPREVDVAQLLNGFEPLLRRMLGEGIELAFRTGPDLWPVLIDPVQLESALLNLCINARDAMPKGGHLRIACDNRCLTPEEGAGEGPGAGDYVLLRVEDDGTGIPAEALPRVFEPFFTTKERGKGTGLGLSMVYGFVKQSQGHVRIESTPESGTTVSILLPRLRPADAARTPPPSGSEPIGGSERVLLVEDDAAVRELARSQLEALGYSVLEASDADAALELLDADAGIDVLFTDIQMPGRLDGLGLARAVLERRPELAVLLASGFSEAALSGRAQLPEGIPLLHKPYRHAELARRMREALARTWTSEPTPRGPRPSDPAENRA